jgi:hypothetical protein
MELDQREKSRSEGAKLCGWQSTGAGRYWSCARPGRGGFELPSVGTIRVLRHWEGEVLAVKETA